MAISNFAQALATFVFKTPIFMVNNGLLYQPKEICSKCSRPTPVDWLVTQREHVNKL